MESSKKYSESLTRLDRVLPGIGVFLSPTCRKSGCEKRPMLDLSLLGVVVQEARGVFPSVRVVSTLP